MSMKPEDDSLIRIEETQAALRNSIERARELAEESDRLLRLHRGEAAPLPEAAS